MNRKPEPLDATERALAELLARDALPGPSPQLDARILAAARSATQPPARRPARRRWVAGLGIAASLVVAVGIAWRLRPLPPPRPLATEAPSAVVVPVQTKAPATSRPADAGMDAARVTSMPAVERQAARQAEARAIVREPAPAEPEPDRSEAADASPVVFDQPAPMDTAAPVPAPPPPPAPLPPAAATPAPAAAAATGNISAFPAAPAPSVGSPEAARMRKQAESLDRVEVTGSRLDAAAAADAAAEAGVSRAVLDEEPPATADSPGVQEAWLQRIRELLDAGDTEAARNSLVEFRRRYPKYVLPEDLRDLATP